MSELANIFTKFLYKFKTSYDQKPIKERKALTLGLKTQKSK